MHGPLESRDQAVAQAVAATAFGLITGERRRGQAITKLG